MCAKTLPSCPTFSQIRILPLPVKLNELAVGSGGRLAGFDTSPLHLHLLSMGINPGMQVKVIRRFPMHGNLYVRIGNRTVVMRDQEAGQIEVVTE